MTDSPLFTQEMRERREAPLCSLPPTGDVAGKRGPAVGERVGVRGATSRSDATLEPDSRLALHERADLSAMGFEPLPLTAGSGRLETDPMWLTCPPHPSPLPRNPSFAAIHADRGGEGAGTPVRTRSLTAICRWLVRLLVAALLPAANGVWAQNFCTSEVELRTTAEAARERSAKFWSGRALPGVWSAPCPIRWSTRTGPGSGQTCYQIQNGEVFGWQMTLHGDRETVLRDVIPHEVDHTVRASLCRRPLPRWLDEGCATLFESETSHEQLRRRRLATTATLLNPATIDQLSYPATADDTGRLYAEGYSLVEYLLSRGTPHDLFRVQLAAEPPSRTLVQVYRTPLPQLLSEWQSWEQKRLSAGTRCDCVNCPWHKSHQPSAISGQPVPVTRDAKPTLTIWSARWCTPCQQFHRDLASQSKFRSRLESKFQLVIRDVDQSPALAAPQGIRSVPVFITPQLRIEGYLGSEWLLKQLGLEGSVSPPAPPTAPEVPRLITPPPAPLILPAPTVPLLPEHQAAIPPDATTTKPSLWSRILGLAPVAISVLTSLGVIGGTAVTGGVGGVALMLLLKILQRRATRTTQGKSPAAEGGVAVPTARAPFPRQLDEAGELLGLRQSEGRVATLDALRGMFLDDEFEKLKDDPDPQMTALIQRIRAAVDHRVDEVAPLTTQG